MRLKPVPKFLPTKCRQLQSFCFYPKINFAPVEDEIKKNLGPKKRKLLLANEERDLASDYPHLINLSADIAPIDYLLQTISFPIPDTLRNILTSCESLVLYFNRTDLLFMWHDSEAIREFVLQANEDVTTLLFAASASLFDVYYHMEGGFVQLDVCIKPRCIPSGNSLPTNLLHLTQYEKVHDFITLQLPDHSLAMQDAIDFIFGQHSETRFEFVSLVKLLYDFCQSQHEKNRNSWQGVGTLSLHCFLSTQLRPYQVDAVKWMIHKETEPVKIDEDKLYRLMFLPITLEATQRTIHFCIPTGTFMDRKPVFTSPCVGGILADEMGLGKTLEVIALIATRPWIGWSTDGGLIRTLDGHPLPACDEMDDAPTPPMIDDDPDGFVLCSCGNVDATRGFDLVKCTRCNGPYQHAACVQYEPEKFSSRLPVKYGYICPPCWSKLRIDSKATLIVAPDHIWQQWKEELQAHVVPGAMEILIYAGMETAVTPVELGCRGSVVNSSINPYSPKSRVSTTLANRMRSKPAKDDVDTLLPGFIQPGQLACADIVLTSYSVVQRELNWAEVAVERHSGLGDRPQLRLTQRYLCRPSPLTCVRWWRVCLDEAQLVERITSKAARMMSHIESVHRWCVTGTPAERSINDLFGLFAFLRFEPFSVQSYWHSQLYQPFLAATAPSWLISVEPRACPAPPPSPTYSRVQSTLLADMLSLILWRNTKSLLGDQLSLPPVTEETHWVTFTSVERYIHDRVLSESATALQSLLNSTSVTPDQTLATLPTSIHCRLVYLVTRLRQACTHASLVVATGTTGRRSRSHNPAQSTGHRLGHGDLLLDSEDADDDGDTSYSRFSDLRRGSRLDGPSASAARAIRHTGTGCSTMTEVIRRVVDDTRRECEGLLRSWVFAKNGAAGCFIIKHQYDLAAECYRDVLRTADNLEKRHGVLADWSQRLHALANLHWLIQSCGVPLLNDPFPNDPHVSTQGGQLTITDPDSSDSVTLDPRVDRDLVPKAERLRSLYIQLHSRLLSRVHENLEPVVSELDSEFTNTEDELADIHTTFVPYGASWLTWLSDAVQYLIDCGLGSNLIEMTVSSFRGKPGVNRSSFRTVLLEVRSVEAFKATLLTETLEILKARHRLRTAMKPLVDTWHSFKAGKAVNQSVLQSFYACCARSQEDSKEDFRTQSEFQASGKQKVANKGRELKNLDALSDSKQKPRKKSHCAYCIAMRALIDYQCALNHERPKAGYSTAKEQIEKLDAADQIDGSGSGMMRSNPLVVSISIVCQQIIKRRPHDTLQGDWHRQARRLEQLFRQMSKEFLLTSSTLTLTKEWWNFHYDMEQFVIRLQANCPSELAFIESHEVEFQLHTYVVDSQLVWPRLQSRLGHFGFLRNAYLAAVTGADQSTKNPDAKLTTTFRLECPTCLQTHNPKNPTFALLPGCWHTLCLPCHDRIASSGHLSQRRCPLCRTPFHSNETTGFNARRRRPLTLIHYDGSQNKVVPESSKPLDELEPPVVGDHSSKIQAVIRCLRKIKEFDPDAKAIVFSSWLSVLITTANALEQNGLAYVTLFQPRHACCPGRLAGFHCPGSATWILLMPIQLGANGLNLTSANHLLLIDPVLSHGREAQAIARMHRIGQTRAGVVHRFLVRDSIEATLHSSHMRAQAEAMRADPSLTSMATTGCMIGAGPRRSTHGSSGLPGPGEDRAFLMQMTIGQLSGLLQSRVTCDLSAEDWDWATPSFSFNSDSKPLQSM